MSCCATATPANEKLPRNGKKQRLEELIPTFHRGSTAPSSWPHPCCRHVSGVSQGARGCRMGVRERLSRGCAHPAELLVLRLLPLPVWSGSSSASLCLVPPSKGKAKHWSLQDDQSCLRHLCVQESMKCRWMEDPGEQERRSGDVPTSLLRLGHRGAQAVGAGTGFPVSLCPPRPWAPPGQHGAAA